MEMSPGLQSWAGRQETEQDVAALAPLKRLEALLDRNIGLEGGIVPPLGHWLTFVPTAPQSSLDADGHPHRGDFLPPVALPRRMWASGKLRFHTSIQIGSAIQRLSTIDRVEEKSGQTGPLIFVTITHTISSEGGLCIEEEQNIDYREASRSGTVSSSLPAPTRALRRSDATRRIEPTPPLLFRYSALTFNAHRIHYDRNYAFNVEGYPALAVHGPLSATLLMDHFLRQDIGAPTSFEFRAYKPLFDNESFDLCLAQSQGGFDLWTAGSDGEPAMTARIETT